MADASGRRRRTTAHPPVVGDPANAVPVVVVRPLPRRVADRDASAADLGQTSLTAKDLLDYLLRRGRHLDPIASPRPALIVLDLELPRLRGLDAVRTIKSNQDLRRIPVVALTHDGDIDAVGAAYDAGINTYLAKPVTFLALVKLMKVFTAYWLETAVLPPEGAA